MEKHFKITRNELKSLIRETIYKLSLLNESVKEGGAAGHMVHPFEIDTYTFADYKQLVRDLFSTKIEKYTEKLDGMNIFATVSQDGSVRFARNKGDIKNEFGGMDVRGMEERWGGEGKDPTILIAYENAYKIFTDVVSKIDNPVDFFNGNGYRIYANCEVIDYRHPNIISYPKISLSFHGLVAISNDGLANNVDLPDEIFDEKMSVLERLIPTVNSQYGEAQVTPEVIINIRENCDEAIEKYISYLDRIEEMAGVNDDTTIIDYRAKLLPQWLMDNGFGIILNNEFTDYFIMRWVYGKKEPNRTQYKKIMKNSGVPNWEEIYNAASAFEGDPKAKIEGRIKIAFSEIMSPVETFFYSLGNEVISGVEKCSNTGREAQVIASYAEQLKQTQELIKVTGELEYQEEMTRCLQKLAALGNKYNALEGVVFKYRGNTLKLTGSFAALNRAINIKMKIGKKQKNQG